MHKYTHIISDPYYIRILLWGKCGIEWYQISDDPEAPDQAFTLWWVFPRYLKTDNRQHGSCPISRINNIPWNYHPPSNSDHQDYYIFNRESL